MCSKPQYLQVQVNWPICSFGQLLGAKFNTRRSTTGGFNDVPLHSRRLLQLAQGIPRSPRCRPCTHFGNGVWAQRCAARAALLRVSVCVHDGGLQFSVPCLTSCLFVSVGWGPCGARPASLCQGITVQGGTCMVCVFGLVVTGLFSLFSLISLCLSSARHV